LPLPRRGRRRWLYATGAGLTLVAGLAAYVALVGPGAEPPTSAVATNFATVRRTDLVSVETFDGTVASQPGPRILGRLNGTITSIAAEGSAITRGGTLYSIDGEPVALFFGALPAWRDIGGAITGEDVRQLEENLKELGYSPGAVDTTFTSNTAAAVKRWQRALGLSEDGIVHLGRVVFAPGTLTVSEQLKSSGASLHDGEEVMSTTLSDKVITATLEDSNALEAGAEVTIVLPGGKKVPAKVLTVDTSATTNGDGSSATTATITPNDAGTLGDVKDGTSLDVERVDDSRTNVLAVPVTALLARAGGGYAVDVDRGRGRTELVRVTPGLYADELVEISGNVNEGDRVVVP
jgi:peptidoglycan hydrolase-like protein with peptidoglycan-binding domain